MLQALAAADRGGLAFGDGFDFGVALHLAFKAIRHHPRMRGFEQGLIDRLLLPVVAVAEHLYRMPARKHIVGEMVVQVDKAGRDHSTVSMTVEFAGSFTLVPTAVILFC